MLSKPPVEHVPRPHVDIERTFTGHHKYVPSDTNMFPYLQPDWYVYKRGGIQSETVPEFSCE